MDGMTGRSRRSMRVSGRHEMEALASAAMAALREAGLIEELGLLQDRVFALGSDRLFESEQLDQDLWHWRFKPMVELLLLHLRDVARAAARSTADRRREIRWALEISGY
jgi:hypothetical protein